MVLAARGEVEAARQQLQAAQETFVGLTSDESTASTNQGNMVAFTPNINHPAHSHSILAAIWGAVEHPELRPDARRCLEAIDKHLAEKKRKRDPQFRELNDSWTNVAAFRLADRELADAAGPESLSQWTLAATDTAPSRGLGLLPTSFRRTANGIEHIPGQVHSQLLFRTPLTGKFEIVARGTFGRPSPLLVGYGMQSVAAIGDPYETLIAQLIRSSSKSAGFPVADLPEIAELRIAVDGTQVKFSINGTAVGEQVLTPQPDPWIALQAYDP
jgi:hypothetical protein